MSNFQKWLTVMAVGALLLLAVACNTTGQLEPAQEAVTVVPTVTPAFDFSGVHIRLHNAGDQAFDNVELTVGAETRHISSLAPGDTSTYHTFTTAQQPPSLRTTTGDKAYEWWPDPAASNGLIAGGEFTFELTLANEEVAVTILMENPILQDAQFYAEDMGIPIAEAAERLQWQSRDEIGALHAALEANESDTFAGLWLQHEPTFGIVVAFTERGEGTITSYVAAESELAQLIEVRSAQYTYAQLLVDQQAAHRIGQEAGFPAASSVNVMENQVELYVTDRAGLEAALVAAQATLPESVVVVTVYEPVRETPPFEITPVPDVFMPQLKVRDVAFMEALLVGELGVENGCLRVQTEGGSHLVIWQADYYLTARAGRLHILNEHGDIAATVGETVGIGGGEVPAVAESELRAPIPESCDGPYWRMGQILP